MLKKTVSARVHWRLRLLGWTGWEHVPVKRCITRSLNIIASWYRKESEKMQGFVYVLLAAHVKIIVMMICRKERWMFQNMGWAAGRTDTHSVIPTWWVACHDTRVWVCLFVPSSVFRVVNSIRDMRFQLIFSWWWCWTASTDAIIENELIFAPHNMTSWLQLWARQIMS